MIVFRCFMLLLTVALLSPCNNCFASDRDTRKSERKNDVKKSSDEQGGEANSEKNEKKSKAKSKRSAAASEKIALNFVKKHHSELVGLLKGLKEVSPKEFGVAVRELSQTSDKLSRLKERDNDRYEIELKSWQARSRGELLATQLQMDNTPKLREQLRKVLLEQSDLRIELLLLEQSRLTARLEKVRQNIESTKKNREKSADKRISKYSRSDSNQKKNTNEK